MSISVLKFHFHNILSHYHNKLLNHANEHTKEYVKCIYGSDLIICYNENLSIPYSEVS